MSGDWRIKSLKIINPDKDLVGSLHTLCNSGKLRSLCPLRTVQMTSSYTAQALRYLEVGENRVENGNDCEGLGHRKKILKRPDDPGPIIFGQPLSKMPLN